MIEVLVTLVVLALGLLGIMGLQARGQQAELESYQRAQALVLVQDIVDRMNANRSDSHNLLYTGGASPPTYPVGGGGALTSCAGKTGAAYDLCDWTNELNGAAEVLSGGACTTASGADCVGAMLGARGCIAYNAGSELTDSTGATMSGTGIYTVTVTWQGVAATSPPPASITCAQGLYPDDAMRRVVTVTFRIANLNSP
jgi:type IV pilus assembly protein PilV